MKQKKRALVVGLGICALFFAQLTACAPSQDVPAHSDGESPSSAVVEESPVLSSGDTELTVGKTTNVVCPSFALSDGFIVPVEQQTAAPDGYIPITSPEEFDKVVLNPRRKLHFNERLGSNKFPIRANITFLRHI